MPPSNAAEPDSPPASPTHIRAGWSAQDQQHFAATATALTAAFGDPTRRQVYLHVRSNGAVTASEIAKQFSLHPNVARHHLDKLTAGGHLEVYVEKRATAGAGRPSKRYRAPLGAEGQEPFPGARNDLLVMLLTCALEALEEGEVERIAGQVGTAYGRTLAANVSPAEGTRSVRSALSSVAEALTAQGFAARVDETAGRTLGVVAEHCPFGDAAVSHPVLCAVERGLVEGMLGALSGRSARLKVSSRARGDAQCATRL